MRLRGAAVPAALDLKAALLTRPDAVLLCVALVPTVDLLPLAGAVLADAVVACVLTPVAENPDIAEGWEALATDSPFLMAFALALASSSRNFLRSFNVAFFTLGLFCKAS